MHPYLRVLVIALVALIVAGALVALALLGRDTTVSAWSLIGAGTVGVLIGLWLFVQSWAWSQRTWRDGSGGWALAIALVGGLAIVVAGAALAGTVILVLTFVLG